MDIFLPVRFRTQVQLSPSSLVGSIDEQIYNKIRSTLEGVCSRHGYIKPNSIEILKRSLGLLMKAHFNGHIKYDIVCKADICNPVRGMIFKAVIKNRNDLGILAENSIIVDGKLFQVLDVLIPRRSAGITSDIDLDSVNIGDEIFIEVLGKRYQLNDKKISIIARAVKEPSKKRLKDTEKQKQTIGTEQEEQDGGNCEENDDYNMTDAEDDDSICDSDDDKEAIDDDDDDDEIKDDDISENESEDIDEESADVDAADVDIPYDGGIGDDEF